MNHAPDAIADRDPKQRRQDGAALRQMVPRSAHAEWHAPPDRADPVAIILAQGETRIPELLPVRHARMQTDPFAFLRGAAAVMAADLAGTPATGIRLQACGDAHLGNFGSFASPEGLPLFDANDFDETLPAPFEWDIKRLAASLAVAGRVAGFSDRACRSLARQAAGGYRQHMAWLAKLSPLGAWSSRIDLAAAIDGIGSAKLRTVLEKRLATILRGAKEHYGLIDRHGTTWRIRERPPLIRRLSRHELPARRAFASYAATLQEDRRVLLNRYRLEDVALKVVGVGSVGTFCAIGLFRSGDDALMLQIKEAQTSVLAPFAGASAYANHGQRVVVGQRMLQAAADVFLGFTRQPVDGRHFYVRRLKDSRLANIGARITASLPFYATLAGRTLARAHARAGDAATIAGYLGRGVAFDTAIGEFALAYADQTERDWQEFRAAIAAGRVTAAE